MKLWVIFTLLFSSFLAQAVVEEANVDFKLNKKSIESGEIHIAIEWLNSTELKTRALSVVDLPNVQTKTFNAFHPVAGKTAFISRQSFNQLTYSTMAQDSYIALMLDAMYAEKTVKETWRVTNKVKAYGLPFKVHFDFHFVQVHSSQLPPSVVQYFQSQGAAFPGTGKERWLVLHMNNFSQLIHYNYSVVYLKELAPYQTLVISSVISGFDKTRADRFFQFPPLSTTRGTMLRNFWNQMVHMSEEIQ